jgi:predicted nucleic acid-binding protein
MLVMYLLEDHKKFAPVIASLLKRSMQRDDSLVMSYLSLAETLVGVPPQSVVAKTLVSTLKNMGFNFLPFNADSVEPFRMLRKDFGLKAPDAMHLASAAAGKVDLFLTGDKQLLSRRLMVPGIQFIADFEHPPF